MSFKKILLCTTLLVFVNCGFTQTRDSIPQKVVAYVTDQFPSTRFLNVEYTQLSPFKYTSKLYGEDVPENKVDNFSQVKVNANALFIKKKKWLLSTTINYRYTAINTESPVSIFSTEGRDTSNYHYHNESINFTYFSKLWNKIAIYSATASIDGSDQHFERIRGLLTGTVLLKATAQTKMAIGLAVFIDPSTQIPALPIFSYEHKFKNSWMVDIILPKKVLLKRDLFSKGRISFGSEIENTSFYIYHLNKTYEFRQFEVNSGIIYEHRFGAFIGTLKTGTKIIPTSRIFEKSDSPNDYFYSAKPKPSFYINLGVSFNPFAKSGKK